jgi:deoxycytidylate deaminase
MSDEEGDQNDTTRQVSQLVRLLLAHQNSGIALKRDDIATHIVDISMRHLPDIMEKANVVLKGIEIEDAVYFKERLAWKLRSLRRESRTN